LQKTEGLFSYSIVVADNDEKQTAYGCVQEVESHSPVQIKYCVEPEQNIARNRNKAVENSVGDYVAFIDDDERPTSEWLLSLFKTMCRYGADGVLGPVNPQFEDGAPKWVIRGKFYDRPIHPTGMTMKWGKCRTGNVLLKRSLFMEPDSSFNPECKSGEDQEFFRRQIARGHRFVWCHEAPVFEAVPAVRWDRRFLIKRALFRGIFAQRNHGSQLLRVLQAVISVPAYAFALPIALALGQTAFMVCVFKLSYHLGRLIAFVGLNPFREAYVLE
jgi:succinoglycan biosynthesis protein ExoM